jgi:hypothetical protein
VPPASPILGRAGPNNSRRSNRNSPCFLVCIDIDVAPPPPTVVVSIVRNEQIGIKGIKEMHARHPDTPPPTLVVAVVFFVVVRALLLQPEALHHNPNRSNSSVIHALIIEMKMRDIRY